jgi:hypothetical protein
MLDELRPRADPTAFSQAGQKRWLCTTGYPFRYVTMPGFFDGVIHSGIAPDDRVDLIATGDAPATHAILVIDSMSNDYGSRVKVSVFSEFKRIAA